MFTSVTIEDANGSEVALLDGTHRLGECHGLHGLPAPRRIVRTNPSGHGEINETRHYASRQPVWNGTLVGATPTLLWAVYDTILRALWGAVEEPRLLRWTRADGVQLQSLVKLGDAFDPVVRAHDAGRTLAYQLILDREDPRNYAQTQRVNTTGGVLSDGGGGWRFPATFPVIFAPSGSSTVVAANDGTTDTPAMLTIVGQASNPQIVQVETGKRIVITGSVGAGSTLVVDGANRRLLLDGVTDRTNLVDFASTDWTAVMVPPGGCSYRLLATSWDATAKLNPITSRDAYA